MIPSMDFQRRTLMSRLGPQNRRRHRLVVAGVLLRSLRQERPVYGKQHEPRCRLPVSPEARLSRRRLGMRLSQRSRRIGGCLVPTANESLDTEKIPSYFFQDTITLVEDRLFATFGSKFDNNNITNFEYQPTAKLAYTPDEKTSIWGAISRAVRTPSLKERGQSPDLQSEDLLSYEVGYRRQTNDKYFGNSPPSTIATPTSSWKALVWATTPTSATAIPTASSTTPPTKSARPGI